MTHCLASAKNLKFLPKIIKHSLYSVDGPSELTTIRTHRVNPPSHRFEVKSLIVWIVLIVLCMIHIEKVFLQFID